MGSWPPQSHAAAGGLAAVLLPIVGYGLAGMPPAFDASPAAVHSFYRHHHEAILLGSALTGAALPCLLWFAVHLLVSLRTAGPQILGLAAVAGLGVTATILAVTDGVNAALAKVGAGAGPRTAVLLVLGGISLHRSGFTRIDGPLTTAALVAFFVAVATTSVALWRAPRAAP